MEVAIASSLGEHQRLIFDALHDVREAVAAAVPEDAEAVTVYVERHAAEETAEGDDGAAEEPVPPMGTPEQDAMICAVLGYNELVEAMIACDQTVELKNFRAALKVTSKRLQTGTLLADAASKLGLSAKCLRDGRIGLPDNLAAQLMVRKSAAERSDEAQS